MAKKDRTAVAAEKNGAAIETTLGALVTAEAALARLAGRQLPIKTAYHVAKLVRLVRAETEHYHAQRTAFIKELGASRDPTPAEKAAGSTEVFEVKSENVQDFQKRMTELDALAVTIAWGPIDLATLGAIEIVAFDLVQLEPLLTGTPTVP